MKRPDEPPHDCPLCPGWRRFARTIAAKHPDWFNGPVPSFGPLMRSILIAGLAPGLQGRQPHRASPFTGDWAGDLLYATLLKHGLATGVYDERPDDTLSWWAAASPMRCAACRRRTSRSRRRSRPAVRSWPPNWRRLANVTVILALGKIAHDSVLKTLDAKISAHPFKHGGGL